MVIILLMGMLIARSVSHTITSLEVPRWADPRRDAELRCAYTRQPRDPPLHSVKWYRGTHEIFRYTLQEFILNNSRSKARAIVVALTGHYATGTIKLTLDPGCRACGEEEETMEHLYCVTAMSWFSGWINDLWRSQLDAEDEEMKVMEEYGGSLHPKTNCFRPFWMDYETREFNSTGISIINTTCDARACAITVRPERGTAKYTCEVSSEGPRFAVDKQSANMTLAVLPEYDPLITGLPTMVEVGENAIINCTSDYSLPAAVIDWFVDGEPQEDPLITGVTHISGADGDGLCASWRTLHVFPDDYVTHRGYLSLRCRATVPTLPPHVSSMSVRLFVASRPHISSYMFSKNNAVAASGSYKLRIEITVWTLVLFVGSQVPLLVK